MLLTIGHWSSGTGNHSLNGVRRDTAPSPRIEDAQGKQSFHVSSLTAFQLISVSATPCPGGSLWPRCSEFRTADTIRGSRRHGDLPVSAVSPFLLSPTVSHRLDTIFLIHYHISNMSDLLRTCQSASRKRLHVHHASTYHDFLSARLGTGTYATPDLAIAFNTGSSQEALESWRETISVLATRKIPSVFTVGVPCIRPVLHSLHLLRPSI